MIRRTPLPIAAMAMAAALASSVAGPVAAGVFDAQDDERSGEATRWRLQPAPQFDALCLAGVVAGDPYVTQFYESQRADLLTRLSPESIGAAERVSERFKAAGVPLIGWLGLVYSATDVRTLEEAITLTRDPGRSRLVLEASPYWNPERWALYEDIRPDLLIYLLGLRAMDYPAWWRREALPELEPVVADLKSRLARLDIIPILTRVLQRPIDGEILVDTTRYCRPFGSRLIGSRFIMDVVGKRDPFRSVGAGALHEMTHPPFDVEDSRIRQVIGLLAADPTLRQRFESRPTDSGYNTFAGYINEDMTRALDQLIGERVGVTFMDDADQRWREQEGGFHMAAAVFYHLMKAEGFLDGSESVTEFLDRMRQEGRLDPEPIRGIVQRVDVAAHAD